MNDELERRIQRALDAGQTLEDTEFRPLLEADIEAAQVARELTMVDAWLRQWGADHAVSDADLWGRVEARLDEILPPSDEDPLAPPVFAEDKGPTEAAVPPLVTPVDRAKQRRSRTVGWWVAAAAVVGLAVTGALVGLRSGAPPQELAMSGAADREGTAQESVPVGDRTPPHPPSSPRATAVPTGTNDEAEASQEARGRTHGVSQAAEEPAQGGLPRRRRAPRHRRPLAIQSVEVEGAAEPPRRSATAIERPSRQSSRTLTRVRACIVPGGPPMLELTAVIDRRTGRVVDVRAPGLREETRRCLRRALRDERFAGPTASGSTEVRLRYRLRD